MGSGDGRTACGRAGQSRAEARRGWPGLEWRALEHASLKAPPLGCSWPQSAARQPSVARRRRSVSSRGLCPWPCAWCVVRGALCHLCHSRPFHPRPPPHSLSLPLPPSATHNAHVKCPRLPCATPLLRRRRIISAAQRANECAPRAAQGRFIYFDRHCCSLGWPQAVVASPCPGPHCYQGGRAQQHPPTQDALPACSGAHCAHRAHCPHAP